MEDMKENELLKVLQVHGEKFMSSFSLPEQSLKSRKHKRNSETITTKTKLRRLAAGGNKSDEDDEEEWEGIVEHSAVGEHDHLDVQSEIEFGTLLCCSRALLS
jgi:hypothetical protein